MRRLARAAAALIFFLLLATPAPTVPPPGPGEAAGARLFVEAVPLNPDAPEQATLGPLRYLGGWALASDDRRFGAISALAVDGDRLLALSDQGLLLRFSPPAAGNNRVEIIPLLEGPGDRASKTDRDGESMVLAGGRLWVAYENSNEIWRYRAGNWRADGHAEPAAMRRWSANRGAEALVRLADNRFLAVREDVDDEGVSDAVLFAGDPAVADTQAIPLRIDPPNQFRVTDGAQLPDGRLLLLCRSFGSLSGWNARLLLAELPAQPGQLMPTREIAAFEAPLTRDNMEAIAVAIEDGRTIIWIASDDNLFGLQRTLLLKFEWAG
jgi:hypothetical protein